MTELIINKAPMVDAQRLDKLKTLLQKEKLVTTGDHIYDLQGRELFVLKDRPDGTGSDLYSPASLPLCEATEFHAFCKEFATKQFLKNVDTILRNLEFSEIRQ